MTSYLQLKLEDGHDVLLVVVDLPGPLETGLHVGPILILHELVDG